MGKLKIPAEDALGYLYTHSQQLLIWPELPATRNTFTITWQELVVAKAWLKVETFANEVIACCILASRTEQHEQALLREQESAREQGERFRAYRCSCRVH